METLEQLIKRRIEAMQKQIEISNELLRSK